MEKSSKLCVLADNTLVSIVERNRCKAENIEYPHDITINKNMDKLRTGIKELEQELSIDEESGTLNSKELKEREDTLIKLTKQFEKLEALMQDRNDITAKELLLGLNSMNESSSRKSKKTVRFSDQLIETDDLDNTQVLQLQQRMMQSQDEDLDRLDLAIGRQREMGILIGEELDYHVELLMETEDAVDRTEGKLNKAKRNLSTVSKRVKENDYLCY
ncbi:5522_t:CDS:2 [Funneliformis caledonium]|uniref:5522_t:CDS:1 n=1 Tax=Funneliformis caledonium TaxID=1117310 RepID=A0A9N9ETF4_9GLOM|nr:5522_t:CDS:2 [Funneliformis caledonium]